MRVEGTLKNLLIILKRLYDGKELSVKELSNELGVSERTVSRYFNEYLKNAGFPLKKKREEGLYLRVAMKIFSQLLRQ